MLQRGPAYFLFLMEISDKVSKIENVEMQWVTDFGLKLVHIFPLLAADRIIALWEIFGSKSTMTRCL